MNQQNRFQGALLGLACGDAVGTTIEFKRRGSFAPVTDMVGGGVFNLEAGQWTDDTSMALCIAVSLLQKRGFNARDIMERFVKWREEGYLSSNGRCFDIGGTVARALSKFKRLGSPYAGDTSPKSAGNGCLMRLAPISMFFHQNRSKAIEFAWKSAKTTHGASECMGASIMFASMLQMAFDGYSKNEVLLGNGYPSGSRLQSIAMGEYMSKASDSIRGNGYVVDSLEAALWCFYKTDNFRDAILMAANLGDDADTTAAITGQIAGAFYGMDGIPPEWVERLTMSEYITDMGARLYRASKNVK